MYKKNLVASREGPQKVYRGILVFPCLKLEIWDFEAKTKAKSGRDSWLRVYTRGEMS